MTTRVRHLSGTCPAPHFVDTVESDDPAHGGNVLRDSELAAPDTLSAETDILSCLDKPDKIPPPYRGGLSVSTNAYEPRIDAVKKMRNAATAPPSEFDLPFLMTTGEVAGFLRKSEDAIYTMVSRAQLPGVVRVRRRLLFRRDDLLKWLRENSSPSPQEW